MEKIDLFKKERIDLGINSFRSIPINLDSSKFEVDENRVIKGYCIVWGEKNMHDEIVLKGATQNSLNARGIGATKNKIAFLKHHRLDQPIARFIKLEEDDYGLYFESEIIKTTLGDETIEEIRSGVLVQLSFGFNYVWDKTEYDSNTDAYILREIILYEISLVTLGSDSNAQLRTFSEYQKTEILKDVSVEHLRTIINLANSELQSRDEHSTTTDEAKVTLF